ncbi:hypothetical protein GGTG_06678 [Gaeumannomyces tritici R3-111a-1]|uniref:Uncharacterized protein n=1 Tax=Gaeumannomyces tritici (strain R3-111a-1) TaxID=644352 RepID=J3NZI0_GAET3|nr:hypothetical protein GGTG_06678 [Gaeumannomyces tritici R3-111a-1]EJT76763.1 hypothetical protein GGTG_06678 [Gaeumannomyces tritici R3-111a-1]
MCKYKYVFFECGCIAGRIRDETYPPCGLSPSDENQSVDGHASDPLSSASGETESQPICKAPPSSFAIAPPCGGCPAWRREGELEAAVIAGEGKLREASGDGELANRHFAAPAVSSTTSAAAPILPATVDAAIRDNVFAAKEARRDPGSREKPFETEDAEMVEGRAFSLASRVRHEGAVKKRLFMAKGYKAERWEAEFARIGAPLMARIKQQLAGVYSDEKPAQGGAADAAASAKAKRTKGHNCCYPFDKTSTTRITKSGQRSMEQEASGSGREPHTSSPARNAGPHGGSAGRPAEALSEKARGKRPEGRRDAALDDEEKASPPASRQPSSAGPAAPASDGQRKVSPTARWSSSTLVNLLEMAEPSSAPRRRASPSAMPSSILRRRGDPTQAAAPRPGVVAGPGNLARPRPGLHQIDQEQWPGLPVLAETSGNAYIGHYGQASDSDEDDYSDDEDDDENNDGSAPAASSHFARRSPWGSSAYQRRRPRQHVRPVTAFSLSTSEASTRESTTTGWRRDGGGYNDDDGAAAATTRPTTDKQVCAALLHRWEAGCRRFEWAARRAGADVRADAVAARRLDETGESLELFKSEIARFCHLYVDGFLDEGPGIFATPSEWAAREERWLRCRAAPGEDVSAELARRASAVDWAAREWARPECGEARPGGGVGGGRRARFLSVGEWVREQDRVLAAGEHVEVQGRRRQEPRRRQVVRETRNVEEAAAESAEEEEEDPYGCDDDDEIPPAAVAGESSASAARKDKRDCSSADHDTSTKPTVGTTSNSAGPTTGVSIKQGWREAANASRTCY